MKENMQIALRKVEEKYGSWWKYLEYILLIGAAVGFWVTAIKMYQKAGGVYADELYHLDQIKLFKNEFPKKLDFLTVIPGMHFIQYLLVAMPFDTEELKNFRFLQALFSFFMAFGGFFALQKIWPKEKTNVLRGLQYALYPMIWFLHFPIYTGGWAIGFAILALGFWVRKWHWTSAIFLGLGVLMRQTVIVILPLFPILTYISQNVNPTSRITKDKVVKWIKEAFPILLVVFGFLGYLIWNGDVASGSNGDHSFGIYPQNFMFFMLILAGFWLPTILWGLWAERKEIYFKVSRSPFVYALLGLLFAWAFTKGFAVNHRFIDLMVENGSATMQWKLLEPAINSTPRMALSIAAAMLSFAWFVFVGLKNFTNFWVKGLVILTMVPFPFMSPRYSAFGAVLLLIFRRPMPRLIELIQLLWLVPFVKFFSHMLIHNGGLWQPM